METDGRTDKQTDSQHSYAVKCAKVLQRTKYKHNLLDPFTAIARV